MKTLLISIIMLGTFSAFAGEEILFCHGRAAIIISDGSGDGGMAVVAKSEHPARDFHSDLICSNHGESYLQLKGDYQDPAATIKISDELCKETLEKMGKAIQLVKGFRAFSFMIENKEVVSVVMTKAKCKNL
ncbi:MAG: hypothetical protein H0V66_05140 [Bdellovibrionales bacterium]|nr:hypothetical protein [Bdellovibrionales bacterium]